MRFFWPRAESRIYAEAKALVSRGLARAEKREHGGRSQTTYAITAAGRAAVREWLATPPRATALECEPLLRILLAEVGDRDQLEPAIAQIRADAHAILEQGATVAPEYFEGRAPFQDQVHVRALVFDFLSSYALMLLAWADRAEAAIDCWPELSAEERKRRALASIRRDFARFPTP